VYWPEFANSIKHLPYQRVTAAIQAHFDNAKFAPRPGDIRGAGDRVDSDRPVSAVDVFRTEIRAPLDWSPTRVIVERYRALVRRVQGRYQDEPERAAAIIGFERRGCRGYLVGIGMTPEVAERWADLIDAGNDIWAAALVEA
jgi:hypothetical protein